MKLFQYTYWFFCPVFHYIDFFWDQNAVIFSFIILFISWRINVSLPAFFYGVFPEHKIWFFFIFSVVFIREFLLITFFCHICTPVLNYSLCLVLEDLYIWPIYLCLICLDFRISLKVDLYATVFVTLQHYSILWLSSF